MQAIDRKVVANDLADCVRELAIKAPEFWGSPQAVMRDLCIDPQALANDLGLSADQLDARLSEMFHVEQE